MAGPWVNFSPSSDALNSLAAINKYANDVHQRKYNAIKTDFAPTTIGAEAASKLAYANLMGPQFLAKLLGNKDIAAQLNDPDLQAALQRTMGAGMGQGTGNSLNNMPQQPTYNGGGQPHTNNFSGWAKNTFKSALDFFKPKPKQGGGNALNNNYDNSNNPGVSAEGPGIASSGSVKDTFPGRTGIRTNSVSPEHDDTYIEQQARGEPSMKMELNGGQQPAIEPISEWQKNIAKAEGTREQGKESGKYRAEALRDVGKSQIALSNSGAALDAVTKIITSPIWQEMRDKIPAFQDKQLGILKVTGTDAEKEIIGKYMGATQALIANTVAGMGNKHLVREYDLAERQKINDSDTTQSAAGKVKIAKQLHDIAEQKNSIVGTLLKQGVDEVDAVNKANKMIDVSAIERATDKLLERKISVTNNKTGETKLMTVKEAQKLGVPNV